MEGYSCNSEDMPLHQAEQYRSLYEAGLSSSFRLYLTSTK